MSIEFEKLFEPFQLKTQVVTAFLCESRKCRIDKLTFTNSSAGVASVRVNVVPRNGVADNTNVLTVEQDIDPGATWACDDAEVHVLKAGDSIQLSCSENKAITVHGSGTKWS